MPRRKKSELERLLEESIKLARASKNPKESSLGDRIRKQDREMPTSLDDPDEIPDDTFVDDDEW